VHHKKKEKNVELRIINVWQKITKQHL